jgi:hypothetical protein
MSDLSPVSPVSTAPPAPAAPVGNGTQANTLIGLAGPCELFHTPSRDPYITLPVKGHGENYPLHSAEVTAWFTKALYMNSRRTPTAQALASALGVLHARAVFDGSEHQVHVRVAEHRGDIVIDLGDPDWRAVRVSQSGFVVLTDSPVKFRRPKGLLALPDPERGGSIEDLRPFMNVQNERQWKLVVAFLLGALRPFGPYPVLEINGDQGSAKSTMAKVIRTMVDPNVATARSLGNERDLVLAANNSWLMVFDNLSRIAKPLSDALCRLSTGGAFATRMLYTNDQEMLFDAQRPMVLNGIGNVIIESDLLDRTLVLELPTIPAAKRQDEQQFWEKFAAVQPKVFGALLDAVSASMRNIGSITERSDWPRMADFAKWVTAAEPQLGWAPGSFMEAYNANRAETNARVLDDDSLAMVLMNLSDASGFSGTATELLDIINRDREPGLPRAGNWLTQRLRELKPNLENIGVPVTFAREGRESKKVIYIGKRIAALSQAA